MAASTKPAKGRGAVVGQIPSSELLVTKYLDSARVLCDGVIRQVSSVAHVAQFDKALLRV